MPLEKVAVTIKKKENMNAINKAWKFKGFLKSENIDEVLNAVNSVAAIYEGHQKEVAIKCENKDFNNVENVDFNTWAYTQELRIKQMYNDLKGRYHDLHFEKYSFNAY